MSNLYYIKIFDDFKLILVSSEITITHYKQQLDQIYGTQVYIDDINIKY